MIDLQGCVFMNTTNDPFHTVNAMLASVKAKVILVISMPRRPARRWRWAVSGWPRDRRAGNAHPHSHRRPARVAGRNRLQTDVGMSGPYDSVIGVEKELVLHRFLTGMPGKFEAAKGNPKMCAALIGCDPMTGRAFSIQRIMLGE